MFCRPLPQPSVERPRSSTGTGLELSQRVIAALAAGLPDGQRLGIVAARVPGGVSSDVLEVELEMKAGHAVGVPTAPIVASGCPVDPHGLHD